MSSQENYKRLSEEQLKALQALLKKLIKQGAEQGRNLSLYLEEEFLVEEELSKR